MRRRAVLACLVGALVMAGSLVPGAVVAQMSMNTCEASYDGPRQGVHTARSDQADFVLWPPNHKLRTVTISAENEDGDACDVTITNVSQDEPQLGEGSGNHAPDAANCDNSGDASSVDLRGERSGPGDGRFYHIDFTMEDPDAPMQPQMDTAVGLVPHDQGVKKVWGDGGAVFPSGENDMPPACSG